MKKKFKNLNFSFVMIYVIHKILVLLKNNVSYLKGNIFKCFFKNFFFFVTYNDGKFQS